MKTSMKKALAIGAAAMILAVGITGCGSDTKKEEAAAKGFPVSWSVMIDGQDAKQEVKKAPTRAVSLSQATTEMMLALGLESKMVGTAFKEEEIYPPLQGAYDKVKVLAEKYPSYEVFMAEKPDFATGWDDAFSKKGLPSENLKTKGVAIFVPESMQKTEADLNTYFDDMLMFGKIFDVQENAQKWVDNEKKKLAAVQEKVGKLPHKRVFVFDAQDDVPFTVFKGYTTNILKLIGADNVMAETGVDKTWATTSWESVVAANPDYIIICDYSVSFRNDDDFQAKVARIKSNPLLQDVPAVKNDRFLKVRLSEITPGPRTVDALQRLAEQLHDVKL